MTNFILILILRRVDIFSVNANRSSSPQFIIFLWFITAANIGFRPERSSLAPVAVYYSLADFSKHSHLSSPACCTYYTSRFRCDIVSLHQSSTIVDQWYNMVGILIWDSGLGHGDTGMVNLRLQRGHYKTKQLDTHWRSKTQQDRWTLWQPGNLLSVGFAERWTHQGPGDVPLSRRCHLHIAGHMILKWIYI